MDWVFRLKNGINGKSLLRVGSNIFGVNEGSAGVLRKVGFQREGTMRDAVWKGEQISDLWIFGITRRDWEGRESEVAGSARFSRLSLAG